MGPLSVQGYEVYLQTVFFNRFLLTQMMSVKDINTLYKQMRGI